MIIILHKNNIYYLSIQFLQNTTKLNYYKLKDKNNKILLLIDNFQNYKSEFSYNIIIFVCSIISEFVNIISFLHII